MTGEGASVARAEPERRALEGAPAVGGEEATGGRLAPQPAPWLDAALSALLPGLGQLRQGEVPRALALALPCLGLWGAVLLSLYGPAAVRSVVTAALLALLYPFLWLPAVLDAWGRGRGAGPGTLSPDRGWYVVLSLLAVGPMALPLLWQGSVFSRRGKVLWTVVVVGIALGAVLFLLILGPVVERWLVEMLELLAA